MAGRPPKYKTVEELQTAIDKYFEDVANEEKPTVTGLAYHLGFTSRQSIYDFETKKKKVFAYTIKRAVLKIEHKHELGLYNQSNAGHIFWLKNRRWSDKQEIKHSGEITGFNYVDSNDKADG